MSTWAGAAVAALCCLSLRWWLRERELDRLGAMLGRLWGSARELRGTYANMGTELFYREVVAARLGAAHVRVGNPAPGRVVLRAYGVPLDAWLRWHLRRSGARRDLRALFTATAPAAVEVLVEVSPWG